MTARWEPQINWASPDRERLYFDAIIERLLRPESTVVVMYRVELPAPDEKYGCMTEVGSYDDISLCGRRAQYIVVSESMNGMKDSRRVNRTPVCSIRHMSRRVRDYFGLSKRAMGIETRLVAAERKAEIESRRLI